MRWIIFARCSWQRCRQPLHCCSSEELLARSHHFFWHFIINRSSQTLQEFISPPPQGEFLSDLSCNCFYFVLSFFVWLHSVNTKRKWKSLQPCLFRLKCTLLKADYLVWRALHSPEAFTSGNLHPDDLNLLFYGRKVTQCCDKGSKTKKISWEPDGRETPHCSSSVRKNKRRYKINYFCFPVIR